MVLTDKYFTGTNKKKQVSSRGKNTLNKRPIHKIHRATLYLMPLMTLGQEKGGLNLQLHSLNMA